MHTHYTRTQQYVINLLHIPRCTLCCAPSLQDRGVSALKRSAAKTLQLNIGLYCNQACTHCHVESSPKRWVCQ